MIILSISSVLAVGLTLIFINFRVKDTKAFEMLKFTGILDSLGEVEKDLQKMKFSLPQPAKMADDLYPVGLFTEDDRESYLLGDAFYQNAQDYQNVQDIQVKF